MSWIVTPFKSVGPVSFGDTRDAVRNKLGAGFTSFSKDVGEPLTDAYEELGLHLYFDDEDRLEFVEAFPPADLRYNGMRLVGRQVDDLVGELKQSGLRSDVDDVGYNFDEVGIGITVGGSSVEGVAVYRQGYYE